MCLQCFEEKNPALGVILMINGVVDVDSFLQDCKDVASNNAVTAESSSTVFFIKYVVLKSLEHRRKRYKYQFPDIDMTIFYK